MDKLYPKERCDLIYFDPRYAQIHQFERYLPIQSSNIRICFNIIGETATSLPKSPVAGFFTSKSSLESFRKSHDQLIQTLHVRGLTKLIIHQAPEYYHGAVPPEWLSELGYRPVAEEIAQYISIDKPFTDKIHTMEKRKLKKADDLLVRDEGFEVLDEVHAFISKCRQSQGLLINISLEKLREQYLSFPTRYRLFTARLDGKMVGAVVMVQAAFQVAYYFLPASSNVSKSRSPMVPLLAKIYEYYASNGFTYLDLGISSVNGKPQEGLIRFKENMGAITTSRISWELVI